MESANHFTVNEMVMRLLMNVAFFQTTCWLSLVSIQSASSHRTDYYMNLDHVQCCYLPSRPVGLGVSHGLTTNRNIPCFFPVSFLLCRRLMKAQKCKNGRSSTSDVCLAFNREGNKEWGGGGRESRDGMQQRFLYCMSHTRQDVLFYD